MQGPWVEIKTWFIFVWAALFSFVAVLLKIAKDLSRQRVITIRDVARAIIDVFTVTFFGGLAGWGMALAFPNITSTSPTVVAIGAALMAYSGLSATQDMLYKMFSSVTGAQITRSEKEKNGERTKGE